MPDPAEVPHLSIQVVNFHRPLLGTFHQKALVVDRRVALLNSNNIQDRPNLEVRSAPSASTLSASLQLDRIDLALLLQMMVHLEGPIVDSLYDNMLISFDEPLKPTLPCLVEPSPSTHPHLFPYTFTDANPYLADIDVAKAARAARMLLQRQDSQAEKGEYTQSLDPPEWWRRDSASPSPWPFGALSHYHPSANLHPAQQPRVIRTDTDEPEGGRFAALVTQLVEKAREEKARLALGMSNVIGGAEHTSQPTTVAGAGATGAPSQTLAVGSSPASHGTDAPRSSVADSGVEMSSKLSGEDGPPTNGHPVSPVLAEDTPTEGRPRAGTAAADGASLAFEDVFFCFQSRTCTTLTSKYLDSFVGTSGTKSARFQRAGRATRNWRHNSQTDSYWRGWAVRLELLDCGGRYLSGPECCDQREWKWKGYSFECSTRGAFQGPQRWRHLQDRCRDRQRGPHS